jgi:anti-sigma B factor antagonist
MANTIQLRQHSASVGIISLAGDITGGPQAVELSTLVTAFTSAGGRHVVVDLGATKLINSTGLGMLVSLLTSMRKLSGTVRLAAVPANAVTLLEITRLNTVFELCASVDDALAKIA